MSYSEFQQAWFDAVQAFKNGDLSYEQLLEFGTLDEFMDYVSDDPGDSELEVCNVKSDK